MSEFKQYKRRRVAELRPIDRFDLEQFKERNFIMHHDRFAVSISQTDREAGSPKMGDMIARNPKNHEDQWLIAEEYFKENFEPLD